MSPLVRRLLASGLKRAKRRFHEGRRVSPSFRINPNLAAR
jgi:hypothetical protein